MSAGAEPGPGEARVQVRAAGVNPIDFKIRSGESISIRIITVPRRLNARAVDEYCVVMHDDVIARKPDQAFDVMD